MSSNPKFNAGDRVRFIDGERYTAFGFPIGNEGVVTAIPDNLTDYYGVNVGFSHVIAAENEIELVGFKPGDKVRIKASVTNADLDGICYPIEAREGEFIVENVYEDGDYDGASLSNGWAIYTWMLEHVNDEGGESNDG